MNTDDAYTVMFWTLVASMYSTRFWFAIRVWRTGERQVRCSIHVGPLT